MRIGPPSSSIERRPLMIWPIVSSVPPMISPVIRTPAIGASARLTGASTGSPLCKAQPADAIFVAEPVALMDRADRQRRLDIAAGARHRHRDLLARRISA